MTTAARAQAGRDRAREGRVKAARERRLRLDVERVAREGRIDESVVDVELAWGERASAKQVMVDAEVAAGEAIGRLLAKKVAVKDVERLTDMDPATVRRLRNLASAPPDSQDASSQKARAQGAHR